MVHSSAPSRPADPLPSPAIPAFCCAVLAAGVFGLLPQLLATTIAVAVSATVSGANLVWIAGRQPINPPLTRVAVGILGAAVLGLAATAALSMAGSDEQNLVTRAGLFVCTALFLVGLPMLPGGHRGRNWVNRTVNGLILGSAALFAVCLLWLPDSARHSPQIVGVLLMTGLASPVLLFGALTAGNRPGGVSCHLGAALCVLGLGDFALAAENVLAVVPVAAALMIFGPVLLWYGARDVTRAQPAKPAKPGRPGGLLWRAGLHLTPVLVVAVAAGWACWHHARPEGITVLLGPVLLALMAVREWLGHLGQHSGREELAHLHVAIERLRRRRPGTDASWNVADRPAADPTGFTLLPGPATRRRLIGLLKERLTGHGRSGALLLVGFPAGLDRRRLASVSDLQVAVGTGGLAARVDDHSFLVLVDGGPMRAGVVAATLVGALSERFPEATRNGAPAVSIGLAELVDGASPDGVLERARIAQRRAARLGTGIEWFDADIAAAEARHQVICRELPGALARDEFTLLYRPVVDLATDRPVGAQPTVRWRSPALGTVPATEFLPAAGHSPELASLGTWILSSTCHQLSRWLGDELDLWMMLRIVGPYLFHPKLVDGIGSQLRRNAVPSGRLVLETSEDTVADDQPAAVAQLNRLRQLGARTGLVATGNSGLPMAQLRRLPVDMLKIGASLEPSVIPTTRALTLVSQIARRYGVELVVDGVGDTDELARVRAAGCRLVAGPVFGAPMAAERFEALLRDFHSPVEPA